MSDQHQHAEDYARMSTPELIERICSYQAGVPLELAQAVVARGSEAVPALCEIVSSEEWWRNQDSAAAIHAMHLLGAIGDPSAASALLAPMERDEPSDFLTENMPGILARLGIEALSVLRRFVDDPDQDTILRSVVYTGLVGMAILQPELRDQVKAIGRELALSCLKERNLFPAGIGLSLAGYRDSTDVELLHQLYHNQLWDDRYFCNWRDIEKTSSRGLTDHDVEHATRDPMLYFAPAEQARLGELWREYEASAKLAPDPLTPVAAPPGPKVGRNAPCPCGSGKKYNKCCGCPGE